MSKLTAAGSFYVKAMTPCNAFTADTMRFVQHFRQLQVGWTANSLKSEGTEQFVMEYLPRIRANNPDVSFVLHRNLVECDPFIVGYYGFWRRRAKRCSWRTANQVLSMVEEMALGGDYRSGRRRGVNTRLPRGLELWHTETRGHDVFEVLSKWKADPVDPDSPYSIRSKDHPSFRIRKFS